RVIDLGQRRERQLPVRDEARQQDRHHQERGGDGSENEDARRVHVVPGPCAEPLPCDLREPRPLRAPFVPFSSPIPGAGGGAFAAAGEVTSTFDPSRMRSSPSVTTRSPAASPLTIDVLRASLGPVVTGFTAMVLSLLTA